MTYSALKLDLLLEQQRSSCTEHHTIELVMMKSPWQLPCHVWIHPS